MGHPKDDEIYPVGTVVRWKKTGEFAIITKHGFQHEGKGFRYYLAEIKGKQGNYCLLHDEIESLPPKKD
jgi:hypothetical protein